MGFHRGPKIVTDGLVLALDAANHKSYPGSGNTWYSTLKNTDGDFTLTNDAIGNLTSSYGGGIVFDGTDDRAYGSGTFIENNFTNNQDVTVEAYLTVTNYPSGFSGLYSNQRYQSEANPGGFGVNIQSDGSNNARYVFMLTTESGSTTSYQSILPENILLNTPHHICYTYIGSTGTVTSYRNGEQSQSSTNPTRHWTTSSLSPAPIPPQIARSSQGGWGNTLPAIYYSLKLYNKALTPQEVAQNYNATKSRFGL